MKNFAIIIAAATVLFVLFGIVEDRQTFARSWFVRPAPSLGDEAGSREAANSVYLFRTLLSHLYSSGGDTRFFERLPATEPVKDEIRQDVVYLRRNGRIQIPKLVRIEVLSASINDGASADVRTREFWVTEMRWLAGGMAAPPRSDVTFTRYVLRRDGSRWIVGAWDPIDPPRSESAP